MRDSAPSHRPLMRPAATRLFPRSPKVCSQTRGSQGITAKVLAEKFDISLMGFYYAAGEGWQHI
jgi:hypothetical protein